MTTRATSETRNSFGTTGGCERHNKVGCDRCLPAEPRKPEPVAECRTCGQEFQAQFGADEHRSLTSIDSAFQQPAHNVHSVPTGKDMAAKIEAHTAGRRV